MGLKLRSGFGTVEEAKRRSEARRASSVNRLYEFYPPKDGSDVEGVIFLTAEPVQYLVHRMGEGANFEKVFCMRSIDEECEECNRGTSKTSEEFAWLIYDPREVERKEYVNGRDTGKKVAVEGSVRVLARGITDAATLTKLGTKYGLLNYEFNISKAAKGYVYDRGDSFKMTPKLEAHIRSLLPEQNRKLPWGELLEKAIIPEAPADAEEANNKVQRGVKYDDDDVEDNAPRAKATVKRPTPASKPSAKPAASATKKKVIIKRK